MADTSMNTASRAANSVMPELKDIHLSYGENAVLRGVNLSVRRGEVIVIVGPSGGGKSSRCAARICCRVSIPARSFWRARTCSMARWM